MRHWQVLKPVTEMNVTNLLDTAFVLLMAFMVVAPSVKHGIEIEVPVVVDAPAMESTRAVTIAIEKRGEGSAGEWINLVIDGKGLRVTFEELRDRLIDRKRIFPTMDVIFEIDKGVTFETIAPAMNAVRAAGIEVMGFEVGLYEPDDKEVVAPPQSL